MTQEAEKTGHSIQFVSKVTGINAHTIRAWEKRYQAIVPKRDPNGRRLYAQEDLDRLTSLHELVTLGSSISDIANLGDEELLKMRERFLGQVPASSTQYAEQRNQVDASGLLQALTLALSSYKLDIVSHELEKAKEGLGPRSFALNIMIPLLHEVGELVRGGQLNIAQEHALSAILRFHIGQVLYRHFSGNVFSDRVFALATPEGELHEFGIMAASLLCGHYNLKYYYLGASLPSKALMDAVGQIQCTDIVLGVSKHLVTYGMGSIEDYIAQIAEETEGKARIWVGGIGQLASGRQFPNVFFYPTFNQLDQALSKV